MDKIDLYDKKILFELDINSRSSASQIAKKIKLPKETINYRIKRLIEREYINYFYTIINASSIGYDYRKVSLKIDKLSIKKEKEIISFLLNKRTCANIRLIQGYYDITFIAINKTIFGFKKLIKELLLRFGNIITEKAIHIITESYKLNQKILFDGEQEQKYFKHLKQENKIDTLDIEIIKHLVQNSRIKMSELAKKLDIHPVKLTYRRKQLENKGIIVRYTTKINLDKLGFEAAQINFALTNLEVAKSIIEFFNEKNMAFFAYEMIGDFDLSIEIAIKNDETLRKVMDEFKQKYFNDFRTFEISHIYKEYVSNWAPFKAEN